MPKYGKSIWKSIPTLRLLLFFSAGILLQYHLNVKPIVIIITFILGLLLFIIYRILGDAKKYAWSWLSGLAVALLFVAGGAGLSYTKNITNNPQWMGKYDVGNTPILLTLQEPIIDKQKSFKALATAEVMLVNGKWITVKGDVLLYFKKDSSKPNLNYGSQIIVSKNITPITNAGNPGGFNYTQYSLFQNIGYQAFLKDSVYTILNTTHRFFFDAWLVTARLKVLSILRNNIKDPDQLSIAEALLIGYRDDLDRDLVQAYSNTGVVHIIAISGLHLGMIYGLILLLFKPFNKKKWVKILRPLTVIIVLWGFSFIAGAAPSILRSAVMFTFIVIGEVMGKRTNMYNSLSASAFVILLFNPFSLWDVGFQLSYAAVTSIVIFCKHIQKWFYFENKVIKELWALNAVTISAQILTLPIMLYHFHQFPNMFLFTNIFAVPFSGLILYAELLLLATSWIPYIGTFAGKLTGWGIQIMNGFITRMNDMPFSVWNGIQISIPQAIVLYLSIIGISYWLLYKKINGLITGIAFFALFLLIRNIDFIHRNHQQKMIVYNVPQHTAIDIVDGRDYKFIGDSLLLEDGFLRNFHLQPSRVLNRIAPIDSLQNIAFNHNYISSENKKIVLIDRPFTYTIPTEKIKVDAIIITKNPKIYISQIVQRFDCPQIIFDAANSMWKINNWKKDCDSLHLRHHSVATEGAFIMDL